jgi:hypothetical protein
MKTMKMGMFCLLCILACATVQAQSPRELVREPDYNKPLLFQQFPQRINCQLPQLESLLQTEAGQVINVNIATNFNFRGVVASTASDQNGKILRVAIRSTNFNGALLAFSKVTLEDGTSYFTGRIFSMQHGDGFEIALENGQYVLNKKGFYDMLNE